MNLDQKNAVANASTGLSLIELLVVLAIIAILAGTALIYINTDGYRLRAEANNLKSTLQAARMEAVNRNERVRIDFAVNSYTVRLMENNNNEEVLQSTNLPPGLNLKSRDLSSLTIYNDYINFQALGTAHPRHIRLTNDTSNYSIRIRPTGRIILAGPMPNDEVD
ncbi:GspH/FimT family pseudopilin [Desulfonatronospira sp.]|uniref:GspH/FimT family pseudopilin n=1 Tax=Desulfonatronospira sp. TaxID=1962951 RepID=UPI0025BECD97|nr:GspH/FimT family pseudopilin [Desulfonatronospira sp.]